MTPGGWSDHGSGAVLDSLSVAHGLINAEASLS